MPESNHSTLSTRTLLLAHAWKTLRTAAIASLALHLAGSIELVVTSQAPERLGRILFAVGWLTLVAIVAYGVTLRARWALWLAGGYSILALPSILLTQIVPRLFKVEIAGFTVEGITLASTVIDLLLATASILFLYGLWRLRQARNA